jgi:hypothetical protein
MLVFLSAMGHQGGNNSRMNIVGMDMSLRGKFGEESRYK